jgi:rfaE bifunctional protein nucleotidyltransferase chain/domain
MKNISKIKSKVQLIKKNNKTIGLCHGVFDLLHYGHLVHFESAKKKCDYLFVSITSDQYVNKGPNRPLNNENERLHFLKNLRFVDYAFIAKGESGIDSIDLIKPNFYFKGNDYKNNFLDKTKKIFQEIKVVKKNKGKIIYTNEKELSSSNIINQHGLAFNNEQERFLNQIRKKTNYSLIVNSLNKLKKDKILIVGDLIIDKYVFGDVLGKSGKEPHMVYKQLNEELYIGGSSIIANHLSDFVNDITLISDCSSSSHIKKLLKKKIKKNIKHIQINLTKNFDTCIKTRFIDKLTKYKLFGSYVMPNLENKNFYKLLNKKLSESYKKHDVIIVADYSNNFFDLNSLTKIRRSKKFISGMSQKNSNNSSFHTLKHLNKFDLICINEGELRSELRDNKNNISQIAKEFLRKNELKFLVITRGINGSILFDHKSNKYFCPSFNSRPIDKIGAGDAMLAVLSILLKNKIDPQISLLIASLASSKVINHLGNSYNINKIELERDLEFLLK